MAKGFKYDVIQLIEGVRNKPCLWDKTLENYKDRVERRNAWEEIFNNLEERYEEMGWDEKRTTGDLILNKWTNIRDTFIKTLKTKMGRPKKKYLLYDHLKFLIKVVPEEERNEEYPSEEPSYSYMKQEVEPEEGTSYGTKRKKRDNGDYTPKKKRDKEVTDTSFEEPDHDAYDTNDAIDFVEVDSDPRLMNEDEAFFASLLPTIVKYSEDERLEFRIEVLAVMKRIKDKRNW
ncbi:uncharacterized protein LOC126377905 [Pectinophora gossypiella]|uniref:uncharacterized protein LOC126377905 n=1 Tax=Pectinophora gossypiella TaxID=13191 RepID=UPI00214F4581|nr:uncharacterized protein LOC126377905 [Pectinophora gossypiella]